MRVGRRGFPAPAAVLVPLTALALVGCGSSPDDSSTATKDTTAATSRSALLDDLGIALEPAPAGRSGVLVRSLAGNGSHTLLRSGDLIVTVNGKRVESVADVNAALRGIEIGDSLALTVVRGSHSLNFTEVLSPVAYLGTQVRDRKERVVVVATDPGGPAATAGLRAGDAIVTIDGKRVSSVSGLLGALGRYSPGDKVTIEVSRGSRQVELTATLTKRPPGRQ